MSIAEPTTRPSRERVKQGIAELVGADLLASMAVYDAELRSKNPVLADILEHTARFRGKQLRPTLLLLTASATGGVGRAHHTLAAVVEMIHVATLLHDDVLDEADVRRHVSTVNRRWNNETSVLFGDYLFTHAFHLAASLDSTAACRRIGAATNRLCEGELTQISHRGNLDLDEATYFDIIDGKTAELCAVAAELGAEYTDASSETVAACETYGRRLGVAFQIADDLLDLVGESRETGKTLGTDLEKQKLTLPIIRLLATASDRDRAKIHRVLAHPNEATRTALEPFLTASDAIDYSRHRALTIAQEAKAAIADLPETTAKGLLLATADLAVDRRA